MIRITDEDLHALPPDIIDMAKFRERRQAAAEQEALKGWQWSYDRETQRVRLHNEKSTFSTYDVDGAELVGKWLLSVVRHVRWKQRRDALRSGWQELAAGRAADYPSPLLDQILSVRKLGRHGAGAVVRSLVDQFQLPIGVAFGVACTWTGSHPSPKWESVRSAHLTEVEAQAMISAHWKRLRENGLTPQGWQLSERLKAIPDDK